MDFSLSDVSAEQVAALLKKGFGNSVEELLYKDFMAQGEVAARKAAKEIAAVVSSRISSMQDRSTMELRVNLDFKMIQPGEETIGKIVDVKNGVPLVAWNYSDVQDLVGKKIFAA